VPIVYCFNTLKVPCSEIATLKVPCSEIAVAVSRFALEVPCSEIAVAVSRFALQDRKLSTGAFSVPAGEIGHDVVSVSGFEVRL